ncbi:MAG TPA: hypothetical protein VF698_09790 [Thermoanaerobaculia bacterium]|jgi:hypothetical protein
MRSLGSFLVLALLLAALPAAAQTYDWSAVGSTGVLVTGVGGYDTTGPTIKHAGTFRSTLTIRYPVVNTYGSNSSKTPPWTTLTSTYTDDGASGSVTTRLVEVDKCSNTETTICTVVSSDGTSAPACSSCTFSSSTMDFANNTYYVEVKLARTNTTALAQIHSVGVN